MTEQFKQFIDNHIPHDKVIVIACLNWGLGHAARCIPIVEYLQARGNDVIIASDGPPLAYLKTYFPELQFVELPSYNVLYHHENMVFNILRSSKSFLSALINEKNISQTWHKKYNAEVIISDNRLMCRSDYTLNIYLCHHINILHPNSLISTFATWTHKFFIKKYNYCLIPDFEGSHSLAPKLSHFTLENQYFVGPISRIKSKNLPIQWDILVVLSGPEPQRSILEVELFKYLIPLEDKRILFIRGIHNSVKLSLENHHIKVINIASTTEIQDAINSSKVLISRSGYTTIMDTYDKPIKKIWIPTPGQTEQEYLAHYHCKNQNNVKLEQKFINKLPKILESWV